MTARWWGPRSLTLPFALLGLCGSSIFAAAMMRDAGPVSALVIAMTTLMAARLGRRLDRVATDQLVPGWPAVLGHALIAGVGNGLALAGALLVAVCIDARHLSNEPFLVFFPGGIFAGLFGAINALPYMLPLLVVWRAHRRALAAREGSLVAPALRAGTWAVALALAAAHLALTRFALGGELTGRPGQFWPASVSTGQVLAVLLEAGVAATAAGAAMMLALGLARGRGLLAVSRRVAGFTRIGDPGEPEDPLMALAARPAAALHEAPEVDEATIDVGIGEDRFVEVAASADPYREAARRRVVVLGNPGRALRVLLNGFGTDAALVAVASLPMVLLALSWMAGSDLRD